MILYPALDIIDGKCVRLYKGDFAQVKIYHGDPLSLARQFADDGAAWLHLVDLDGAKNPEKRQISLIHRIAEETSLSVQTGGGLRTVADVRRLLEGGVTRVVLGSLCVKDRDITKEILQNFGPDKICLAMDVVPNVVLNVVSNVVPGDENDYRIVVSGWQEKTDVSLHDLIETYQCEGLKNILCTDISRDGTLTGTNVALYKTLCESFPNLNILASGGISGLNDLLLLSAESVGGAVIGKALYEGVFTLREALMSC